MEKDYSQFSNDPQPRLFSDIPKRIQRMKCSKQTVIRKDKLKVEMNPSDKTPWEAIPYSGTKEATSMKHHSKSAFQSRSVCIRFDSLPDLSLPTGRSDHLALRQKRESNVPVMTVLMWSRLTKKLTLTFFIKKRMR